MARKIALILLFILYIGAGINHFWHPQGYYTIIPPYFSNPFLINALAGIAEITCALLLLFPTTRKWGSYGIILMLIAFIPAHVYMIQKGGCMGKEICIPAWAAWLRLFPLQLFLIVWAWWAARDADESSNVSSYTPESPQPSN